MAKEQALETATDVSFAMRSKPLTEIEAPKKRHEVLGVLVVLISLFLFLSLISYGGLHSDDDIISGAGNIIGFIGEWTAYLSITLIGLAAFLFDGLLWMMAISLFRSQKAEKIRAQTVLGMIVIVVLSAIVFHTVLRGTTYYGIHKAGGFVGELLGEILTSLVSTTGTYLIALGGILVVLLLITDLSVSRMVKLSTRIAIQVGRISAQMAIRIAEEWKNRKENNRLRVQNNRENEPQPICLIPTQEKENISPGEERIVLDANAAIEPKIVKKKQKLQRNTKKSEERPLAIEVSAKAIKGAFQLPSPDLLMSPPSEQTGQPDIDEPYLKEVADNLVRILSDFGVFGEVREIHPGPVVTMFEFQPKSGTKLSKIESLSNEIAMALEVLRVRVVAPIPGKNAVGFELPNKKRETVYLKELITDDAFEDSKAKLPLSLGKDISGTPYYVDLAKMPHLLIAGTTGSGKSVSLNAMLLSLLYKYTPDDLRLLLIDPKMIELGIYDKIPHLLLPVVTDMSKACLALKWAVDEMERRYQLFADIGVRNLASYNAKIEKLKTQHSDHQSVKKEEPSPDSGFEIHDNEVVVVSENASSPEKLDKLPLIVVVVDELADLMMVAAKDVETSIARLAQKARASGLHLIVATQRPSVDVITGLIKANFPSRISFRVSSGHDSRTILGVHGAENLLGMGDMLIMPPGTSDLIRVHGAFVDDDEIHDIVNFLKSQGAPEYDEEILKPRDDDQELGIDETEKDEIYDQAVAIVAESRVCSISMLQRRLRIGYNRSARIVEIMEKEGIVGPANGVNKREVLISPLP